MSKTHNICKATLLVAVSLCLASAELRLLPRPKRQFDNSLDFLPPLPPALSPPQPGGELIFSNNGAAQTQPATPPTPSSPPPTTPDPPAATPATPGNNAQWVFINNRPRVATMTPFTGGRTTPTPQFLSCFSNCPTTSQYNPICASNMELYGNEQKFNCAVQCGADIQVVRRGSCEGLFPMSRG